MSRSTGTIAPLRCNSHLCPSCSPLHQMTARHALESGTWGSLSHGQRPLWLTLTEPSRATLDLPRFMGRWEATIKRLRRNWGVTEYGLSIEFQKRGALHPHVVLWAPPDLAADLADRKTRSSYCRRMHELRPMAIDLGWGQMVDAVAIAPDTSEKLARYAAKNVADYATKEARAAFKRAGAKRVRPVRLSRGFYPGGLAAARERVREREALSEARDPGPWVRVTELARCGA